MDVSSSTKRTTDTVKVFDLVPSFVGAVSIGSAKYFSNDTVDEL